MKKGPVLEEAVGPRKDSEPHPKRVVGSAKGCHISMWAQLLLDLLIFKNPPNPDSYVIFAHL